MKNALIVFYSHSGNTRRVAGQIQHSTQGSLLELQPVDAYPTSYDAVVAQAKKEIQAGYHPILEAYTADLATFDTIFVGTPNWWSTIAPPLVTFLTDNDLTGKTFVPFCTHGGGGVAKVEKDIAALCPHAVLLPCLVVSGDGGSRIEALVEKWLKQISVKK
ncbi:MAG: NAD(P)H-dependent oxidoreductase [Parabacteroides sp.]|nr:NAD(P)H-dependent oxidoreductase [Parabacteroides sp.]